MQAITETETKQSHWFFQRIHAMHHIETMDFELAGGLGFLLRRFHLIQPEYVKLPGPTYIFFPKVGIEFVSGTGAIRYELQPIPAPLYSAPRFNDVQVKTEIKPFDLKAFGVNLSAVFKP